MIGAESVAVAAMARDTPAAFATGLVGVADGADRTTPVPVVNVWVTVAAMGLPATSTIPGIVNVYAVEGLSRAGGTSVSVWLALLSERVTASADAVSMSRVETPPVQRAQIEPVKSEAKPELARPESAPELRRSTD